MSLRDLVMSELDQPVERVMRRKPVTVDAHDDREAVANKIAKYNLLAVPVLEQDGSVVGFVTVDDVIDVMIEEGTEDALRMGAVEPGAMDEPYVATPFWTLVRKRAGWLILLFLSEMLTATAMGRFEEEIARAVVLALFVPLIISSGGNSGSQAASLIIRALAVGELRLKDWWRVMRREILSGLVLGSVLGFVGFVRISAWSLVSPQAYGPHWPLVAVTIWVSLIGVVLWGTVSGSMLPILLKRLGMDPGGLVGAVRRDARRRHRHRHLLPGRRPHPPRHAALERPPSASFARFGNRPLGVAERLYADRSGRGHASAQARVRG